MKTNKIINKKRIGFTLIELLVVIAVIGLLASIVLVALGQSRAKARNARRQADIRQLSTAMELYYGDNVDKYLTHAAETTLTTPIPTYMLKVPTDPLGTTTPYVWVSNTSDAQKYCIYATLESPSSGYVCASNAGVFSQTTALPVPILTACCY